MSEHSLHPHYKKIALYLFLILQFFTAFADNALIFAEISILKKNHSPSWEIPMLQDFFVIGYIVLAPFVALIADKWSKKLVLIGGNLLKLFGAILLLLGLNPLISCVFIGIGCAVFSPAKYGILPELVDSRDIVKANGLLELSTICAVLIGALTGGYVSDHSIDGVIYMILGLFILALIINLFVPLIPASKNSLKLGLVDSFRSFYHSLLTILRKRETLFSVINTSIFGASSSTLRFLLVAWIPFALHENSNEAIAYMNSFAAIGVAIGAIIASKYIKLKSATHVLIPGVSIGVLISILSICSSVTEVYPLMICIGIAGGLFIIPLNAYIQEEGKKSVGAGHAVTVQNFCENILMLIMVGIYSYLLTLGFNIQNVALGFGVFIGTSILSTYLIIKKNGNPV